MQTYSESASPSYQQQRAADSLQERLEQQRILKDMEDYIKANSPSYGQQRAADSIQERLEVQQILEDMWEAGGSDFKVGQISPVRMEDVVEFFGDEVVETIGHDVLAARLEHYQADGSLSSRDLERLDQEIDVLMMAAVEKSSEAQTDYHREIERLEEKISAMLAEASRNPSTNLSQLDRQIERLDYQIDMLRLAAMEQQ